MPTTEKTTETPAGSQTLARGLAALELICGSSGGLTIQEVAERLDIHRTIASRLLSTLVQFRLVARHDGRFHPAAGLAVLGAAFDHGLRELSAPVLRQLADGTHATAALLVAEGHEQVAVSVITPMDVPYHLSFREGTRYPLDRGAAGIALLAGQPPREGERDLVTEARAQGWVMTHGEVENAYGLAVPVRRTSLAPPTCVHLVSHRSDVVEQGREAVIEAALALSAILS